MVPRSDYFGNFFIKNKFFVEKSKITEYGIGGIILDRFFVELCFLALFTILGVLLPGPKILRIEPKTDDKEVQKIEDKKNNEQMIGALLLDAIIILPALIAMLHARSQRQVILFACLYGGIFSVTGFFIALWIEIPTSSAIALIATIVFLFFYLFSKFRR